MTQPDPNLAEQLRDVRVGVRPELDVSRHIFAGEPAYVVLDPVSFQSHRLSQADYQVFTAINDRQKLGAVFAALVAAGRVEQDQEEEFYAFVLSLTQWGLLALPLYDGGRLFNRYEQKREAKKKGRLMRSLFLRVPLVKPDRFLNRTMHLVAPLFTRGAFALWALCLAASLLLLAARWQEFTSPLASILAIGNLPVLWTLLVLLKLVHELGHAYACKRFGGHVPEMGAYFILLTPCAYVDATSSWGFPSRWHRVIVALAGMFFESIAAMFALALWALTPDGALHDAAHYAVVLSTAVTIAFNANPLMRYDGYYVLSDALGIPNLRAEADGRLRGLAAYVLYGVPIRRADMGWRRSGALAAFGLASAVYKVMLLFGISLVIAQKLPLVGFGVAGLYVLQSLRQSGLKLANYLRFAEELEGRRRRAVGATLAVAAVGLLLVCALPVPGGVEGVGVVTRQEELTVRAQTPGFVRELLVESGDHVTTDSLLCRMENIDIEAAVQRLAVQEKALEVQWKQAVFNDRQAAAATAAQLADLREQRKEAEAKRDALAVRSARRGVVTGIEFAPLGTFLHKGEAVASVGAGPWTIRVLLTSEQVVDAHLAPGASVKYRLIGSPDKIRQGTVETVAAQGNKKVERRELTQLAGGNIAVDPQSYESNNRLFEVRIGLSEGAPDDLRTGNTAQVRFQGDSTTLLKYLYRRGLQLINDLRVLS